MERQRITTTNYYQINPEENSNVMEQGTKKKRQVENKIGPLTQAYIPELEGWGRKITNSKPIRQFSELLIQIIKFFWFF